MGFKKRTELHSEETVSKIMSLRHDKYSFSDISSILEKEKGIKVSGTYLKVLYERKLAELGANKVLKQQLEGKEGQYDDYQEKIQSRYDRIAKLLDELIDAVDVLKAKLTPEQYLKYAPLIIALSREVLNQLFFLKKEQENIQIKQQTLIYSPIQVAALINQNLYEMEKQGFIKIVKFPVNAGKVIANPIAINHLKEENEDEDETGE